MSIELRKLNFLAKLLHPMLLASRIGNQSSITYFEILTNLKSKGTI